MLGERYSASGLLNSDNSWSWTNLGNLWVPTEMEVCGAPVWGGNGCPNGGFVHGKGKALGGGNADADARKGAGADSHGNGVHVGQLQVRIFQDVLHNGHQCAAVGQTGILVAGG